MFQLKFSGTANCLSYDSPSSIFRRPTMTTIMIVYVLPIFFIFTNCHAHESSSNLDLILSRKSRFSLFPDAKRQRPRQGLVIESVYNISENLTVASFVASLTAYASKPGDLAGTNYSFRIAHESDVFRQFSIDPKQGIIRVAKPLDREQTPNYRLRVEVTDKDGTVVDQSIAVNLIDVNDNAPYLNDSHLIVWEDQDPGFVGIVTAYDPDGPGNGPPFFMRQTQDSPYLDLVDARFENKCCTYENGYLNISSLRRLDREGQYGKVLMIPILTSDSGNPQQNATRFLRIEIGDKNDNPMTDGISTIHVYNYKGQIPSTLIGRVFVNDLDDWDVVDKDFTLKSDGVRQYFQISNDGLITMIKNTPLGTHTLEVAVFDRVRNEHATGTVNVVVDYLDEEAIDNAGSVRIRGISAEDFLRPLPRGDTSPYERFRSQLARQLGLEESLVKIFSILAMPGNSMPPYVEVFFAVQKPAKTNLQYGPAHGSYLSSVFLTGVLERYRTNFDDAFQMEDVSIVLVNIDPCVYERCTDGGCTRVITPIMDYPSVIMANKTSLVGVNLTVDSECQCPKRRLSNVCQRDTCFNGGVCHNTVDGFFCECRGSFNNGSRCENRMRTFANEGFAWLKPIGSCDNITISLEFMTKSDNAILLYNGPMRERRAYDNAVPDMLAVQIKNGKIEARINLGVATTVFSLNSSQPVNDGEWHILDIVASRLRYEMTLDRCLDASHYSSFQSPPPALFGSSLHVLYEGQTSSCKVVGIASGSNEQLNVDDPLQLGGVASIPDGSAYMSGLTTESLIGCIRNLKINGELYDLGDQGVLYAENSDIGCMTSKLCQIRSSSSSSSSSSFLMDENYCIRGECIASISGRLRCVCEPGWHGSRCDKQSKWKLFMQNSFVQYSILENAENAQKLSPLYSNLRFLVLPQNVDSGDVGRIRGASLRSQNTGVGFNGKRVEFTFNFGDERRGVGVPARLANYNQQTSNVPRPLLLEAERFGVFSRLSIDGLTSDPYAAYRIGAHDEPFAMHYDLQGVLLGAGMVPPTPGNDYLGCISEFYFNDIFIPVGESDDNVRVTGQHNVQNNTCPLPSCATADFQCAPPYVCLDFWKGPFCSCPYDQRPQLNEQDGTLQGCGALMQALHVGVTHGAIAVMLISLVILIVLVSLLVVHSHQRRKPAILDDNLIGGNVCDYKEEGGGEADQGRYDICALRKPIFPSSATNSDRELPRGHPDSLIYGNGGVYPMNQLNGKSNGIDAFLTDRMNDVILDPFEGPVDELFPYNVESDRISLISLSSLESEQSGFDNNINDNLDSNLNGWGPKFKVLSDLYRYDKRDKTD